MKNDYKPIFNQQNRQALHQNYLNNLFSQNQNNLMITGSNLFVLKSKDLRIIIGLIYIKELHWSKRGGEFAYCIDYNYKGRGITTQVIQTSSSYAFENLGLAILQIIVHKTNTNSIKVKEKCNFTWIRTLLNSYTPPGKELLDMEFYERYKS